MNITVSQAISQADLRTPNMNRLKLLQQQLRTVVPWEFFLLYLSLFKVIPET